ncbi:hypothetical protein EV361DRAFT_880934 [Lentinula raphanica]|uniref:Uncharacterized protein n=1 Tax=Lentinula raphanica TaxID=153919 RepID=A0AA38UKA3_9AGAR|nr:hypothetical protein C8R42DRAFT_671909 [Lentinula raphanica]KAJ3777976.1 hypothetical protein FB446DRAFT_715149 [Lentinula raphanica]KAJ3823338.1 hypothetical protein F5880DRAFT_1567757 [Lentinula raphanica]KAJ3844887.1 hypothetical protein F5878DRAFT_600836 [Lentinula raphanica]KAJ3976969.1 hypothetical protein EV361DRAFT_880934 [Lentinula raphanica]
MPALLNNYEVLLDFNNDTSRPVSIQLSQDYGRNTTAIVLLLPSETLSLILQPGSLYRYAVKINSGSAYKVADVSARSWRDIRCDISHLFSGGIASRFDDSSTSTRDGVVVDRLWRDYRISCFWDDHQVQHCRSSESARRG